MLHNFHFDVRSLPYKMCMTNILILIREARSSTINTAAPILKLFFSLSLFPFLHSNYEILNNLYC